ncbi:MAG: ABC transporter permease [Calothrix sp. CSU_2_0]|nr:ABC transporter permease [Calothrix sp. CSU_2_0]
MVTNNNSDWEKLNYLATRYINLHKINNSPFGGQLSEEINQTNSNQISTQKQQNKTHEKIYYNSSNYISKIFREQIWNEILQLLRTPTFLVGIALFASFVSFLPFRGENAKEALASFSVLILLTICIDRLGKRISVERAEGWLKLLKATPLPPGIYIAAKVFTTLLLSAVTLILIMILGVWRLEIDVNPQQLLLLFIGLILGVIPFAILGLALSYLTEPKSYDSIAGLSIPIGLATSGALQLTKPSFFPNIVLFSPFYHYRELTLWAAGINYDEHILFHLLWLIWAGCVFGLLVIWAYQRDSVTE